MHITEMSIALVSRGIRNHFFLWTFETHAGAATTALYFIAPSITLAKNFAFWIGTSSNVKLTHIFF